MSSSLEALREAYRAYVDTFRCDQDRFHRWYKE